jgi:hypothetical protein
MNLPEFFAWLIGGGGIGLLTSRFFTWLNDHWFEFAALRPDLKRVAVFVGTFIVAAAMGALVILAQAWFGGPLPTTAQEWVLQLFAIGSAAVQAGQVGYKIAEVRAGRG